ncbi:MAG: MarC family protein [Bacteroidetes bacterium]|nr:MarC family protein [Bacteroidota bacterium]
MNELLRAFILLFAVIDPIGTIPVFLSATSHYDNNTRRKVAVNGTLIAAAILLFFIAAGQVLIEHMQISLAAFKVAGGLVLLLFALTMVFRNGDHGAGTTDNDYKHIAVFPIAVPAVASPGAILAVVLLTDNNIYSLGQQLVTTGIVLLVLIIVMVLLLSATRIQRAIGKTGITVITKIMGILLCSLATESVLAGIREYFSIHS